MRWYRQQSAGFKAFTGIIFVLAFLGASVNASQNPEQSGGLVVLILAGLIWAVVAAFVWKAIAWVAGLVRS